MRGEILREVAVGSDHLVLRRRVSQVERRPTAEQRRAQHRPVRLDVDRRAGRGRDRAGGDVGLLRGEAALLERPAGHVADGVDVIESADPAPLVDRGESPEVVRHAGHRRPEQDGKGDGEVHTDRALWSDAQAAVLYAVDLGARDETHVAGPQEVGDLLARTGSERLEGLELSGREQDVGGDVALPRPGPGLQRELVQRKRPRGGRASDVRDASGTRADALQRVLDGGRVLPAAERKRTLDGRRRPCAEREHEHVVGHPVPALGDRLVAGGVDAIEGVASQVEAAVLGDRGELGAHRPDRLERRAGRGRPVNEVALRREHVDVEPARRERLQRQNRLEAGDAAAGDEDLQWAVRGHARPTYARGSARRCGLHTLVGTKKPAVWNE